MFIKHRTVFVLGAGASGCYGFPLGIDLLRQVVGAIRITPATQARQACGDLGDSAHLEQFATRLVRSGATSIDKFIAGAPEFTTIAKRLIAAILLDRERDSNVCSDGHNFPVEGDWARYLFDALIEDDSCVGLSRAKVVTFNFDRSLERRLFTTIEALYGLPREEAAARMRHFQIVHVSGWLGRPDWDPNPEVAWGAPLSPEAVLIASSQINFVHEPRAQDGLSLARDLIGSAPLVCYLGFGFHPENLKAIQPADWDHQHDQIATGLGFTSAEAREMEAKFALPHSGQLMIRENLDCLGLLRNEGALHWTPPKNA